MFDLEFVDYEDYRRPTRAEAEADRRDAERRYRNIKPSTFPDPWELFKDDADAPF